MVCLKGIELVVAVAVRILCGQPQMLWCPCCCVPCVTPTLLGVSFSGTMQSRTVSGDSTRLVLFALQPYTFSCISVLPFHVTGGQDSSCCLQCAVVAVVHKRSVNSTGSLVQKKLAELRWAGGGGGVEMQFQLFSLNRTEIERRFKRFCLNSRELYAKFWRNCYFGEVK